MSIQTTTTNYTIFSSIKQILDRKFILSDYNIIVSGYEQGVNEYSYKTLDDVAYVASKAEAVGVDTFSFPKGTIFYELDYEDSTTQGRILEILKPTYVDGQIVTPTFTLNKDYRYIDNKIYSGDESDKDNFTFIIGDYYINTETNKLERYDGNGAWSTKIDFTFEESFKPENVLGKTNELFAESSAGDGQVVIGYDNPSTTPGALSVTGNFTILGTSSLIVSGGISSLKATEVKGEFSVKDGSITKFYINSKGDTTISGTLNVTSGFSVNSFEVGATIPVSIKNSTDGAFSVTGGINQTGSGSALNVSGKGNFNNDVDVSPLNDTNYSVKITGGLIVGKSLKVKGNSIVSIVTEGEKNYSVFDQLNSGTASIFTGTKGIITIGHPSDTGQTNIKSSVVHLGNTSVASTKIIVETNTGVASIDLDGEGVPGLSSSIGTRVSLFSTVEKGILNLASGVSSGNIVNIGNKETTVNIGVDLGVLDGVNTLHVTGNSDTSNESFNETGYSQITSTSNSFKLLPTSKFIQVGLPSEDGTNLIELNGQVKVENYSRSGYVEENLQDSIDTYEIDLDLANTFYIKTTLETGTFELTLKQTDLTNYKAGSFIIIVKNTSNVTLDYRFNDTLFDGINGDTISITPLGSFVYSGIVTSDKLYGGVSPASFNTYNS